MEDLSTRIANLSASRRLLLGLMLEQRRLNANRHNAAGGECLAAFIAPRLKPAPEASDLRSFLENKLPEYMVPSAFVMLDHIPLTPSGKLDRRALLSTDLAGSSLDRSIVAPRDFVELQLVRLWEEILDAHPIGVRDNFFEMGGHSLLAIRLTFRIQQTFGVELPLSTLFQAATVEDLAVMVRQQAEVPAWSPLVCIQAGGSNPPFFCVHPGGGNVLCYFELAQRFGPTQPFYAFQARGLNGEEPSTSVEEMASQYIKAMRKVQPHGPYLLGGWSIGGVIAFEMAQQIEAADERVALLALIDTSAPGGDYDDEDGIFIIQSFAYALGIPLERFSPSLELIRRLDLYEQFDHVLVHAKEARVLPPDITSSQVRHLFALFTANSAAVKNYKPRVSKTRISLLTAARRRPDFAGNRFMGWENLAEGGADVYEVPGNHFTMLREPEVKDLAARLKECIDRARS